MQRHNEREDRRNKWLEIAVYNPLRILWATIMNRHRGKGEKQYRPEHLLKLSIDKDDEKKVNMKEVIQKFGKTFKKNGG